MRKSFRKWTLIFAIPVMLVGFLMSFSFLGVLIQLINFNKYEKSTMIVDSIKIGKSGGGRNGSNSYKYISGMVDGVPERFVPLDLDLIDNVRMGQSIPVLINRQGDDIVLQGSTIRVIDSKVTQGRLIKFICIFSGLIYLPIAIFLYLLYTRSWILYEAIKFNNKN